MHKDFDVILMKNAKKSRHRSLQNKYKLRKGDLIKHDKEPIKDKEQMALFFLSCYINIKR